MCDAAKGAAARHDLGAGFCENMQRVKVLAVCMCTATKEVPYCMTMEQ